MTAPAENAWLCDQCWLKWKAWLSYRPALSLLDSRNPGSRGREILETIRSQQKLIVQICKELHHDIKSAQ